MPEAAPFLEGRAGKVFFLLETAQSLVYRPAEISRGVGND